ncbi:response regulator [Desulfocicer niacini]
MKQLVEDKSPRFLMDYDPEMRVLVVEDDEGLNRLAQKALKRVGFETTGVYTGAAALASILKDPETILLVDQFLPDMTGTQLIRSLQEHNIRVPFVAMTGQGSEKTAVEMMKMGARDYLVKGFDLSEVLPNIFLRVFRELETERRLALAEMETQHLQEQFAQAQKLESIGRLAGGVAHDLNNLLSPILGYGEMLLEDTPEADPRREFLKEIVSAGSRARDMVGQLLAFSRKQTLEFKPVDLNDLLKRFEKLLRRTIREDVTIKFNLAPGLPLIKGDVGQLEQVVMNLAVNAQDAMPHGGSLAMSIVEIELDDTDAEVFEGGIAGPHVMLTVKDTGTGMTDTTLQHLYEPFYTTKEPGKGTGLGLATVYGIVKQHDGTIQVESAPTGTVFRIYFPVGSDVRKGDQPEAVCNTGAGEQRGETILLVEDNESVRDLTVIILKREGYDILVAENGNDALARLEGHHGNVSLMLTDVVMPEMNGKELFNQVSALYPEIKVIYMSGYTDEVIAHHGIMDEGVHFIQKPFSVNDLSAKLREVLDQ